MTVSNINIHPRNGLQRLWEDQAAYNAKIKAERPLTNEEWAKQYLLGLVGEVDEVLREINWKHHRKTHPLVKSNLARELADLLKYTLCLWQLYGYTADEMIAAAQEKTEEMAQLYRQEFLAPIAAGTKVVLTDIDGTLGDWRAAFVDWCHPKIDIHYPDYYRLMAIETELDIPYPTYIDLKQDFEENGGYLTLKPYNDGLLALKFLAGTEVTVVAFTARPVDRYSRLWSDTWQWLSTHQVSQYIRELQMGSEERTSFACDLVKRGCQVVMMEDNPTLAMRAAKAGVDVYLRKFPYNRSVWDDPNIHAVDLFNGADILETLEELKDDKED